jgi:hypothetical protein
MALLDALHEARAPIELACVSTCGGAHHALEQNEFGGLLLSTSLCLHDAELRELAALWQRAHLRGLAVLSVSPSGLQVTPELLGVPLHESLDHHDVALGRLGRALERAYARARMDHVLEILARHDRAALSGRASLGLARDLASWLAEAQKQLATARPAVSIVDDLRQRLAQPLATSSLLGNVAPGGGLRALQKLVTLRVEAVLDRAAALASSIAEVSVPTHRDFTPTPELAVEEAPVCQLFVNLLLALLGSASPREAEWSLSTRTTEHEVVVELANPNLHSAPEALAALFDPFGASDGFVSGIGLWAGRQLLARWGVRLEAQQRAGALFRVAFPARVRSRSERPLH